MRFIKNLLVSFLLLVCLSISSFAVPAVISYQAKIANNVGDPIPNGLYTFTFSIYTDLVGGTQTWTETQTNVQVTDGFISVLLGSANPITDSAFVSTDAYLEIIFQSETISPRSKLSSVPFSHSVYSINNAKGGTIYGGLTLTPDDFSSIGNAITILDSNGTASLKIYIGGDGSGVLDFYDPVDSRANNDKAASTKKMSLRKEGLVMFGATTSDTTMSLFPNGNIQSSGQITMGQNSTSSGIWSTVFGFGNVATADSATISGGYLNLATGFNAVIGGGSFNEAGFTATVGGGVSNTADSQATTIGGGNINEVHGPVSVIAGGGQNTIQSGWASIGGGAINIITTDGLYGTIAGGSLNAVYDTAGVVGGGSSNIASASYGTVPGGRFNQANGKYSFAAGKDAIAAHAGSFVWSDTSSATFFSNKTNEFAVNAQNGMRIQANNTQFGGSFTNLGNGDGVRFFGNVSNGNDWGSIYATNNGSSPAIVAQAGTGLAANFLGNINVTGSVSKASGSFKIDHPLDPANKFLYHSFVESPDMKNIYDGNITTNSSGTAVVVLPDYFEALNKDFRYQLTVIGSFARAIVAEELVNNSFVIKTDEPNIKVSWQITGIRKDAYANAHRIPTEVLKDSNERGKYLYPELFGYGKKSGIYFKDTQEVEDKSDQIILESPKKDTPIQTVN